MAATVRSDGQRLLGSLHTPHATLVALTVRSDDRKLAALIHPCLVAVALLDANMHRDRGSGEVELLHSVPFLPDHESMPGFLL